MALLEKVSYLKGMAEGMKISEESNEGRLLHEIIKTFELFAEEINAQQAELDELDEYVEELDEALEDIESIFDEDEDEDDDEKCCCCDDDDCDCDCDEFDDDFEEVVCPKCHEIIRFEGDLEDEDELHCPVCDELLMGIEDEADKDAE